MGVRAVCISAADDLTTSANVRTGAADNCNHDGLIRVNLDCAAGIHTVSLSDDLPTGKGEDQITKSSFFWVTCDRGDRADVAR